ncbi:uncharacterized protein LOC103093517 isoform X2 [Monodelphis domestica]|uniref:uncharacterized protein LOC103093517 isoform X2 n=2 Tax=Monodelphis domestica TaxID=13616 RepID=UPI00044315B3|nr:uncharacterized protein LOC103093517 isoform X2 [Monodelphis domestica]
MLNFLLGANKPLLTQKLFYNILENLNEEKMQLVISKSRNEVIPNLMGNKPLLITFPERPHHSPLSSTVEVKKDLTLPSLVQEPETSQQVPQLNSSLSSSLLDLPDIDEFPLCPDCLRMKGEDWGSKENRETRLRGLPHFLKPSKKKMILETPAHLRVPLMDFMHDKWIQSRVKIPKDIVSEDIEAENVQYRLPMRDIWCPRKPFQTLYTDLLTHRKRTDSYKKHASPDPKSMWAEFNITKIPKHSKFH